MAFIDYKGRWFIRQVTLGKEGWYHVFIAVGRLWFVFDNGWKKFKICSFPDCHYAWEVYLPFLRITWLRRVS